ncbi:MAG: hypothetical protein LBP25_05160 [Tannerellaceae bacterium]|jgi:hypothetical protein|nr:hypothetical protein [Tannerellaceae bacterium]
MDLDLDIIYSYLAAGLRTPQNKEEESALEEIREIIGSGKGIELSFN